MITSVILGFIETALYFSNDDEFTAGKWLIAAPLNAILASIFSAVMYGIVYLITSPLKVKLDTPYGNFCRYFGFPLFISLFFTPAFTAAILGLSIGSAPQ